MAQDSSVGACRRPLAPTSKWRTTAAGRGLLAPSAQPSRHRELQAAHSGTGSRQTLTPTLSLAGRGRRRTLSPNALPEPGSTDWLTDVCTGFGVRRLAAALIGGSKLPPAGSRPWHRAGEASHLAPACGLGAASRCRSDGLRPRMTPRLRMIRWIGQRERGLGAAGVASVTGSRWLALPRGKSACERAGASEVRKLACALAGGSKHPPRKRRQAAALQISRRVLHSDSTVSDDRSKALGTTRSTDPFAAAESRGRVRPPAADRPQAGSNLDAHRLSLLRPFKGRDLVALGKGRVVKDAVGDEVQRPLQPDDGLPPWISSAACVPKMCTPRIRRSLGSNRIFSTPYSSPMMLPRAVSRYLARPLS